MGINSFISTSYNNSNIFLSSQGPSQAPPSLQSWSVNNINVRQLEMPITKLQHLKETMDSQMGGLQTGLTAQIKTLNSKFNLEFDSIKKERKHSMPEPTADWKQQMLDMVGERCRFIERLVWCIFFGVSNILICTISYLLMIYRL